MADAYEIHGGNVVATMEVPRAQTARYGVIDTGGAAGDVVPVLGLVEKPDPSKAPSNLAVIGRYILTPEVFVELGRRQRGAGGEIQLTDAMARLIARQPFHGLKFEGRRFDCGDKLGFLEANLAYALARDDLGPAAAEMVGRLMEDARSDSR
jgi:UTP--glucose-1-phosphate uridylyltransferase